MEKLFIEKHFVIDANNNTNSFYFPLFNSYIYCHLDKIVLSIYRKEDRYTFIDSLEYNADYYDDYQYEFTDEENITSSNEKSNLISKKLSDVLVENGFQRESKKLKPSSKKQFYKRIFQHNKGNEKINILYEPKEEYYPPVQLILYNNTNDLFIYDMLNSFDLIGNLSKVEFAMDFYCSPADRLKIKDFLLSHFILRHSQKDFEYTNHKNSSSKTFYQGNVHGPSTGIRLYEKMFECFLENKNYISDILLRLEIVAGRRKIRNLGLKFPLDRESINAFSPADLCCFLTFDSSKFLNFIEKRGLSIEKLENNIALSKTRTNIKAFCKKNNYTNYSRFFKKIDLGFLEQIDGADFLTGSAIKFNLVRTRMAPPIMHLIEIKKYINLPLEELNENIKSYQNKIFQYLEEIDFYRDELLNLYKQKQFISYPVKNIP